MGREFSLSIVAPDKLVVEQEVVSVVAPGREGYLGIHRDHEPLIAALKPGLVEYLDPAGSRHFVYVGGGFAEISGTSVTLLADEAAAATEIDISQAETDLENAKRALRGDDSPVDTEDAMLWVERAVQRLRAARLVRPA